MIADLANRLDNTYQLAVVGLKEAQIKDLPRNVLGVGHLSSANDLCAWYTAADCFVNPTLEDTMPLVNLEALACARRLPCSALADARRWLPMHVVWWCQRMMQTHWRKRYSLYAQNQKASYYNACIEQAARFSMDKTVQSYYQLYQEVCPMNILFLSLLYHPDAVDQTLALSKTGLQNQANTFQWAMIDGIRENLRPGETLSVLNALPVGIYPKQYKKICLQTRTFDKQFMEIGSWNLPICKQKQREHATRKYIERWMEQSEQNRMIVLYSLYLPYLRAIAAVKHKYPALKSCVIVTDLPGHLGLASGRQGVLKALEYRMGEQSLQLASQMDGFILLTEQMAEPLQAEHKKRCVIEGLVGGESVQWQTVALPQDARPAVLYTGTLNRELGIDQLLEAFHIFRNISYGYAARGIWSR